MRLVVKANPEIEILGTLENIAGRAEIVDARRLPDGPLELDYEGTEVFWDGQITIKRGGQRVYLDRSGNEYLESELDLVED